MSGNAPWPWSGLGLDGAVSEREVRRAYAAKLKTLRIEDQPEAFAALRQAYEAARRIAAAADARASGPPPSPPEADPEAGACGRGTPETARTGAEDPSAPSPSDATRIGALPQAIAQMTQLLARRDYDLERWQTLLTEPILEDMRFASAFEAALVAELARTKVFPDESGSWLDVPADWAKLIEDRYGWVADGLRFQQMFSPYLQMRSAFARRLPPPPSRGLPLDLPPLPQPAAKDKWYHPINLFSAPTLIIAGILATSLITRLRDGLPPVVWTAGVAAILCALTMVTPLARMIGLHRLRLSEAMVRVLHLPKAARAFVGVPLTNLAAALVIVVVTATAAFALLWSKTHWLEIPARAIYQQWRADTREAGMIAHDTPLWVPVPRVEDRTISDILRKLPAPKTDPLRPGAFGQLNLPYPVVRAAVARPWLTRPEVDEDSMRASTFPPHRKVARTEPQLFRSTLICSRDGTCALQMEGALTVQARVAFTTAPSLEQSEVFQYPALTLSWNMNAPQTVTATVWSKSGFSMAPRLDIQRVHAARSYAGREDGGRLPVLRAVPIAPGVDGIARIALYTTFPPDKPVEDTACERSAIDSHWTAWTSLSPDRDKLVKELCTLPAGTMQLSYATCPADGAGGTLLCRFDDKGLIRDARPLGTDPAGWGEAFDQPLDIALSAQTRPGIPLPPEAKAQIGPVSDQIIRDFLTLFWDQPVPPDLQTYLDRHPPIAAPGIPPSQQDLIAAAARQPQLASLYPIRNRVGTAALEDMFGFLGKMGFLRD
uniref:hypothetical protein n=1 Tax=Paenirhodobacter enshiensis TaxID=1105367 RepID=UPI0035B3978D